MSTSSVTGSQFYAPIKASPPSTVISDNTTTTAWTKLRKQGCEVKQGKTMRGNKNHLVETLMKQGLSILDEINPLGWCYGHGGFVPIEMLEADHLQPESTKEKKVDVDSKKVKVTAEGVNDIANKWLLCRACNGNKTDSDPLTWFRSNPGFGSQFLQHIAYRREEPFAQWVQSVEHNQGCEVIYKKEVWKVVSKEASTERVKVVVHREGKMPMTIRFWKKDGKISMTPDLDPSRIKVVHEHTLPLLSLLEVPEQELKTVIYKEVEWQVIEDIDSDTTEFTIQRANQKHRITFDLQQKAISVDKIPISSEALKGVYRKQSSLKRYRPEIEGKKQLEVTYRDPSNPEWTAQVISSVELRLEIDDYTPFSLIFDQNEWIQSFERTDRIQEITVIHPVSSPLTFCRNDEGVLCAPNGIKLGTIATDYFRERHDRRIKQMAAAQRCVVLPLNAEIDTRNQAKYEGKQVDKKLCATDKKLQLLEESVKQEDPFLSSDSDDDLDPSEKRDAFQEAARRLLSSLKQQYKEEKQKRREQREFA